MSFILDALKKSEAERRRQDAPGLAAIPEGGARAGGSKWMWLAVVLLLVNLAVISGLLLDSRDDAAQEPAVAVTVTPRQAGPEPERATPVAATPQSAVEAVAVVSPPVDTRADDTPRPADPVSPVARSETPPAIPASETLATFNELRAQGMLNLPDLHLDIHVYSGEPVERFVFVNMSKYTENATLAEGPAVREITPDGVILDYRGTAFLLPRE